MILGVFAASRAAARAAGVQFDTRPLGGYWQYADPDLLRHDYLRTLWYLHSQPPGFNAFLGAVLRLPDGSQRTAFILAFLACGVAIMLGMYALATTLGVPRAAAAAIAIAFGISPAAIVYENLLFYTYPVAAGLCLTFVALARYVRRPSVGWGLVLFAAAAAIVFMRATYHLLWFVAILVVVLIACPRTRRLTVTVALVPLLLTSGLYVKNWLVFDSFGTSSWLGMNFANVIRSTPEPSTLTTQLRLSPFADPAAHGADELDQRGVPVLDERRKSTGRVNYNHIVYVEVGRRYLRADLAYVRRHPVLYARVVARSMLRGFEPATGGQGGLAPNVEKVDAADRLYNLVVGWQAQQYSYEEANERRQARAAPDALHISWSIVLLYAISLATLPTMALRARRTTADGAPTAWVLALASATIWLSFLSTSAFEVGENARFRVETDPLAWVLSSVVSTMLVRAALQARRARSSGHQSDRLWASHSGSGRAAGVCG